MIKTGSFHCYIDSYGVDINLMFVLHPIFISIFLSGWCVFSRSLIGPNQNLGPWHFMDDKLWWMTRNDHESLEPRETPVPKVPRGTTNTAPSADVIEVGWNLSKKLVRNSFTRIVRLKLSTFFFNKIQPRTRGIYLTKAGLLVQVPFRIPHSSGLKNRSKNGTHPDLDYAFVNAHHSNQLTI